MANSGKTNRLTFLSWFNLAMGLLLATKAATRISSGKLDLWTGILVIVALYLVVFWLVELRDSLRPELPEPPPEESSDDDEPIRSLVLLLDGPRDVSNPEWIGHLGEALGVDLQSDKPDATDFVLPIPHPMLHGHGDECFMLQIPAGAFWIFHVRRPYFDDVEGWAKRIPDKRIREAVAGHHAWISVDLVSWKGDPADTAGIYDVIGKAIAALAGPDARVIFCPELQKANEFDPMLLPALSGGDPLGLFDGPTFAPVLESKSDDEQMEAAIAEARNRWPEFVDHFNRRDPEADQPFIIKAPFRAGENTEHMWTIVTGLEDESILGELANQPHHLPDHYQGQKVRVALTDLTDWLCSDADGEPLGGWTQKVLNAKMKR